MNILDVFCLGKMTLFRCCNTHTETSKTRTVSILRSNDISDQMIGPVYKAEVKHLKRIVSTSACIACNRMSIPFSPVCLYARGYASSPAFRFPENTTVNNYKVNI